MSSVKLDDLMLAFHFVSTAGPFDNCAYISRSTGRIHWVSDFDGTEEDLPDDLEDSAQYIEVPHKNDLDLGKRLVFKFVNQALPSSIDEVGEIFHRKGAYSRFKNLLERMDRLDDWHRFQDDATVLALRQWCEDEGIELIEGGDDRMI